MHLISIWLLVIFWIIQILTIHIPTSLCWNIYLFYVFVAYNVTFLLISFVLKQRASDITVTCHQGRAVLLSIKKMYNVHNGIKVNNIFRYLSGKFCKNWGSLFFIFKHMYLHAPLTDSIFEYTYLNIKEFLPFGLNNSITVKRSLTKFNFTIGLYPNKFKNSVFDNNVIMAFFIQKRASILYIIKLTI